MSQFIIGLMVCALAGCGAAVEELPADEIESADELDSKSDSAGNSTYYEVTADTRLCPSPKCRGWWVKRTNQSKTKCVDGSYDEQCYVGDAYFADGDRNVTLPRTFVLAKGAISLRKAASGDLAEFVAKEVWEPSLKGFGNRPDGVFYRIKNNTESKLNSATSRAIESVVFPDADYGVHSSFDTAREARDGAMVVGSRHWKEGSVTNVYAEQFYLRIDTTWTK